MLVRSTSNIVILTTSFTSKILFGSFAHLSGHFILTISLFLSFFFPTFANLQKIFKFFKHFIHSYFIFCLFVPISSDLNPILYLNLNLSLNLILSFLLSFMMACFYVCLAIIDWELIFAASSSVEIPMASTRDTFSFTENLCSLLSGAREKLDYVSYICILTETWHLGSSSPTPEKGLRLIIQFLELA